MGCPTTGATLRAYCECANKKRDESAPVIVGSVETTWICNSEYEDSIKTGVFSSMSRHRFFWQCLNCGKKRFIGIWGSDGHVYSR